MRNLWLYYSMLQKIWHLAHLINVFKRCLVWDMCQIFSIWHISHICCGWSNTNHTHLEAYKLLGMIRKSHNKYYKYQYNVVISVLLAIFIYLFKHHILILVCFNILFWSYIYTYIKKKKKVIPYYFKVN